MSKKDEFFAKLAVSKQIMNKVDNNEVNGVKFKQSTQQPVQQPVQQTINPNRQNNNKSYKNLKNSKMPDFIKEAMINNPIIDQPIGTAFSMNDVPDSFIQEQTQQVQQPQPVQQLTNPNNYAGLNESEIRGIVRDEMSNFFIDYFKETIKEQSEKKLLKELINKGIIKRKKR